MTASDTNDGEELAAPLDLMLTDAALGLGRRLAPNSSWLALGAGLIRRPRAVTRRGAELARQLTQITVGQSKITPEKRDRRFADAAWRENPVLRRTVQAYLAAETTAEALVADAGLGWRDNERVRFVLENVFDAVAPSNNPLISPVAWKAVIDTGGGSLLSGLRNLVRDSLTAPRVPSMVEPDAFEVGKTLAITPGAVVFRSEVLEVIQYVPQREKVRQYPLLMIPPVINKFYILDLAPDLLQPGHRRQPALLLLHRADRGGVTAGQRPVTYARQVTERIVVIGADAAGMSAASQAKRIAGDAVQIIAFERGTYSSYAACGIPYWVAGDIGDPERLIARSPDAHRRNGIDLHMRTEVEEIDLADGRVTARDLATGRSCREGFDSLVITTGAVPVRPPLPGADAAGVFGVQTLDDGAALLADLDQVQPQRAVVVGGGYIGVEMAEALVRHGVAVTVVDHAAQPMTTLDPDMGEAVHRAMEGIGIDVRTDTAVTGFETGRDRRIRSVVTAGGSIPADVVVLGIGVRPNTALAREAGLPLGDQGGLRTNVQMQVLGHDHVWAGGDCVEVLNLVSGQYQHVALGTHANKQGRVIGHNLAGSYATFPGVVGTAVSKVCHLEIARTGLRERDATRAGFKYVTVTVQSGTKAGYFPGTQQMTVKMTAERLSGRLLGVQIVGHEGSAKRIDTAATALWNHMTVEDMIALDLAYAPPFAPVWDPILVAARQAAAAVRRAGDSRR